MHFQPYLANPNPNPYEIQVEMLAIDTTGVKLVGNVEQCVITAVPTAENGKPRKKRAVESTKPERRQQQEEKREKMGRRMVLGCSVASARGIVLHNYYRPSTAKSTRHTTGDKTEQEDKSRTSQKQE